MSLRIVAPRPGAKGARAPAGPPAVDTYMERLVKLVPVEAISAYPLLQPLTDPVGPWAVFVLAWVLLAVVVALRWKATSAPRQGPQWVAVGIAAVSFVIWVYVMKGDFGFYELFLHFAKDGDTPVDAGKHLAAQQFLSSLALVVWTLLVPVFYKGND